MPRVLNYAQLRLAKPTFCVVLRVWARARITVGEKIQGWNDWFRRASAANTRQGSRAMARLMLCKSSSLGIP